MLTGTVGTLLLIYLSPVIQVDILKEATAWFSLRNPGIVTIPGSFLVGIVVSLLTRDDAALEKWDTAVHDMVVGKVHR
jgi:cation/acetate symporter